VNNWAGFMCRRSLVVLSMMSETVNACDIVEFDIHLTKDEKIVVIHNG